jgi:hypothetical protein
MTPAPLDRLMDKVAGMLLGAKAQKTQIVGLALLSCDGR